MDSGESKVEEKVGEEKEEGEGRRWEWNWQDKERGDRF